MKPPLALEGRMIGEVLPRASTVSNPYEDEFIKAFDEHANVLFRHACFRVSNRERAVDLTQEAFIKAWEYLRNDGEIRHWKSFLYHVLNNLIIDEYRRKKDQSLDALFEEDPVRANSSVAVGSRTEIEERLDEELLIKKIQLLIPQLPEQQRAALTFRYIDGFSPKEIARMLGTSENVVSVRIHRAIERLKKLCRHLTLL